MPATRSIAIGASLALLAALGASCSRENSGGAVQDIRFEPGAPPGVQCVFRLEHRPQTSVETLIAGRAEETFDGAVLEGRGLSGPSELYLLFVDIANSGSASLDAPDLIVELRPSEPGEFARRFLTRRRAIAAGSSRQLVYLWDPGAVVGDLTVRLDWASRRKAD